MRIFIPKVSSPETFLLMGISGYKFLGKMNSYRDVYLYKTTANNLVREYGDEPTNPMELQTYIDKIGDNKSLSICKRTDISSVTLQNQFHAKSTFEMIHLDIHNLHDDLSAIWRDPKLIGRTSQVALKNSKITHLQAGVREGNNRFDYVTFECEEVIQVFR